MISRNGRRITLRELGELLPAEAQLVGDPEGKGFTHAASIGDADRETLAWINPARADKHELLAATAAEIVVCDPSLVEGHDPPPGKCLVVVPNPKVVFSAIVEAFFIERPPFAIHPTAVVHPEATLEEPVSIGPFTYLGRCSVGAGTIVHGHVHVYDGVVIGRNVTIHAGTVIGGDGFGYEREDGQVVKFPHLGTVVIEDDVEIHALVAIDRGSLNDTIIRRGAKIDNLVHVAHNVEVGEGALVVAHSMLGGSLKVGRNTWLGPDSVLRDNLSVGDEAFVGIGSLVVKDVPPGTTVMGSPAREAEEYKAMLAALRSLTRS